MQRLTDFLICFSVALLLHALLVLGTAWFWTLRPPELRPVFQGGDVSLTVTFVTEGIETQAAQKEMLKAPMETGQQKAAAGGILTGPETEFSHKAPNITAGDKHPRDTEPMTPENGPPTPADGGKSKDASTASSSGALHQGVRGTVLKNSEIRPYYPLGARLRGEEGAVTVRVWVKPSGRAGRCEVTRSSGFPILDKAAVDAARQAQYVATQPGAWRAEAETTLTFRFKLKE